MFKSSHLIANVGMKAMQLNNKEKKLFILGIQVWLLRSLEEREYLQSYLKKLRKKSF